MSTIAALNLCIYQMLTIKTLELRQLMLFCVHNSLWKLSAHYVFLVNFEHMSASTETTQQLNQWEHWNRETIKVDLAIQAQLFDSGH